MKKYIVMFLACCPLMAFGAPSVRALGAHSVAGTTSATASKVTPSKSGASTNTGASVARVGSLRAKPVTTGTVGTSAAASSTSRFPVILPTKVYNTAAAPRPTGNAIINQDVDLTEVYEKIQQVEDKVDTNTENITTNTNNITTNTTNISTNTSAISTNTTNITNLSREANSIRVGGADKPDDFDDANKESNRAWIWVEQ